MDFFVITSLQKISIHMRGLFLLFILCLAFGCGNEKTGDTNNTTITNKEKPKHFDFAKKHYSVSQTHTFCCKYHRNRAPKGPPTTSTPD